MRAVLALASAAAIAQKPPAAHSARIPPERLPIAMLSAKEVRRWPAPEARQGVAVDADYFYAIVNTRIGKYDKSTGRKVGEWVGDRLRIIHLNSCAVIDAMLVCAHSNFPEVPMASSVEFFDPATMRHVRSVPLGIADGSLTWIERHGGKWWAGFANYDDKGGEPGRDHRFTQVVMFDDDWRRLGGYRFPDSVLQHFAPLSNSGGSWGADGLLYVTGHDAREIYVLREPGEGPTLEHLATIAAPLDGQAWAWDRSATRTLYGITRRNGEVVVIDMPRVPGGER
jgi:hypothetical protein